MTHLHIARIISGGQSGVDRAALDVAIESGIDYGGWCPQGGWAEDLAEPPGLLRMYPNLKATSSSEADVRTRLNVRDSHATLILRSATSPGTDLTEQHAHAISRPVLVIDDFGAQAALQWIAGLPFEITLNVAGPRETEQPGAYSNATDALRSILGHLGE